MKTLLPYPVAAAVIAASASLLTAPYALSQGGALEEVIVTAQKRSENVLDVPISITVFSANEVEELSARNLTDLGRFTAGVTMNNSKTVQQSYTVRGIETNDWTVGSDPAIAVYVDGVYAARGAGAEAALVDLARIEILKGPQGTLFGRNATGGAIHIISQPPVFEQEGRVKVSAGNYNRLDAEAMYNLPITDSLAMRAVLLTRTRDGFIDNLVEKDLNDEDRQAARLSLLWDASASTSVLWRMEYSELEQNSAAQTTLVAPVFENANPGRKLDEFGKVATDFLNLESREMFGTSLEINHEIGDMTLTSITGWREFETELDEDLDGSNNLDYSFNSRNPEENDFFSQEFRLTGFTESLKWTVGATYTKEHVDHTTQAIFNVSSLETFAWAEILRGPNEAFLSSPFGGSLSPEEIAALDGLSNYELGFLIPEFRQANKDAGLDGLAGSTFVWDFLNQQGALPQFGISTNPFVGIGQIFEDWGPRVASFDPWIEEVESSGTFESAAIFFDGTWHLSDNMNLTGGLRYTRDEKEFSIYTAYQNQIVGADFGLAFFNNGNALIDATQDDDWSNLSGRLVFDYQFENAMAFASVSTGFKSGGFNTLNFGPEIDTSYDEEEVINYEVGMKGQFIDNTLQLNVSGFFYEYDNLQELRLLGQPIPSYNLRNSDAEGYGAEVEVMWVPTDQLRIGGNYSWLKTEYTDYTILPAAGETEEDNFTGASRFGFPENKINLMMQYTFLLGDFGSLVPRIDYTWNDGWEEDLIQPQSVDSFGITNARITLFPAEGNWEVALWSTNLFDEEIFVEFGDNGDQIGTLTASRLPPQMYGADLLYHF